MSLELAVNNVLSRSRIALAHPGGSSLTEFYAKPSNCQSVLSEAVNAYGRNRVSANSKSFGSTSNFNLSSSDIVSNICLTGSVTLAANTAIDYYGWGFDAIGQIEILISNSVISNLSVDGQMCKEYMLASCRDKLQRERMLAAAGTPVATAAVGYFSIPVQWLLSAAIGQPGAFPIDMSTLSGSIQFNVALRSPQYWIYGAIANVATVTQFTTFELTHVSSQFQDAAFSVRSAMSQNPGLVYSTPCRYITSVPYPATITPGTAYTINLTSAPAGILDYMLVKVEPASWVAGATLTSIYWQSATLSSLRLRFGGQDLFNATSLQEMRNFYRLAFQGDDLSYSVGHGANASGVFTNTITRAMECQCYVIPFTKQARECLENLHENLPSYGGSSLELTVTVVADGSLLERENATPFTLSDSTAVPQGTAFNIRIGWVISGILEVGNGVVDLVL